MRPWVSSAQAAYGEVIEKKVQQRQVIVVDDTKTDCCVAISAKSYQLP